MSSVPPGRPLGPREESLIPSVLPVIERESPASVLLIDHDLGFLLWLGDVCAELGYEAVPALHCRQALTIAKRLQQPIKTVVINPELHGARRMVQVLLTANPALRVIRIYGATAQAMALGANGQPQPHSLFARRSSTLLRPSPCDGVSRTAWLAKVRRLLLPNLVN